MNYFLDVIKNKYAQFSGRATRSEYWYFILFMTIIYAVAVGIDMLLVNILGEFPILSTIALLGFLVPSIAVGVRRLHDINASGWWYLLAFVPILSLVLIVFFVIDSKEDNAYGPNPKA